MSPDSKDLIAGDPQLFRDIAELIRQSRQEAARELDAQLTELYWQIGRRLPESVLGGERAAFGEQAIGSLSRELTTHFGRGWSAKQLHHCLRIPETFPDAEIVSLELDAAGIHVAEYLTTLPPKEVLQARLQQAMAGARLRLAAKEEDEKEGDDER